MAKLIALIKVNSEEGVAATDADKNDQDLADSILCQYFGAGARIHFGGNDTVLPFERHDVEVNRHGNRRDIISLRLKHVEERCRDSCPTDKQFALLVARIVVTACEKNLHARACIHFHSDEPGPSLHRDPLLHHVLREYLLPRCQDREVLATPAARQRLMKFKDLLGAPVEVPIQERPAEQELREALVECAFLQAPGLTTPSDFSYRPLIRMFDKEISRDPLVAADFGHVLNHHRDDLAWELRHGMLRTGRSVYEILNKRVTGLATDQVRVLSRNEKKSNFFVDNRANEHLDHLRKAAAGSFKQTRIAVLPDEAIRDDLKANESFHGNLNTLRDLHEDESFYAVKLDALNHFHTLASLHCGLTLFPEGGQFARHAVVPIPGMNPRDEMVDAEPILYFTRRYDPSHGWGGGLIANAEILDKIGREYENLLREVKAAVAASNPAFWRIK